MHSKRLGRRAKYIAQLLAMFMDTDDGHTWVSQSTLAYYGGYRDPKPIALGMRELRAAGYLRSRRIARKPEPGFHYVHYAALPCDRDRLKRPSDPYLLSGDDRPF